MEYITVYELHKLPFEGFALFFLVLAVVILISLIKYLKDIKRFKLDDWISCIFWAAVMIICIFIGLVKIFILPSADTELLVKYYKGEYDTVEGFVENYKIENEYESFDLGGLHFSYWTSIHYTRYNDYGNHIRENGQQLRLYYILDEYDLPEIVRIDEMLPVEDN